jgi:hypothetical protein
MTHRSKLVASPPRKPQHFDLLYEIWRAASAEPIGLLLRVPDTEVVYWKNQLYRVRTYSNDQSLFELELGMSRFPEEANLQIVRRNAIRSVPNHAGDIDLRGVLNLNLPDD